MTISIVDHGTRAEAGSGQPSAEVLPALLCPVALRLARSRVDFIACQRS
ncbi:hypothetical protein [Streptomyces sp. NPDC002265]